LVDRLRRQQVPGGDRVVLADAVDAVLGLVVDRRGPLELQEADVRGARERDALGGDGGRADQQRGAAAGLERGDGRVALGLAVAAQQVQRLEALQQRLLDLLVV